MRLKDIDEISLIKRLSKNFRLDSTVVKGSGDDAAVPELDVEPASLELTNDESGVVLGILNDKSTERSSHSFLLLHYRGRFVQQ